MAEADRAEDKQYKAIVLGRAHGMTADKLMARHWWLGVPIVVFSALVGTTTLATRG
ncbi:hypothetical protein RLW55_16765 [Hyphomicrobium sp. B1]|uniref:hypothetical protein n=1 Tax=Hyphomicrobium sp. B1 TaxID=3075651 RepID=UPI003C2ED8F5